MSCSRAQEFLGSRSVSVKAQRDARKSPLAGDDALEVLEGVDELFTVKGKRVMHIDLRASRPDPETLKSMLLGPTGGLRAPTVRRGRTLLVGFDAAAYAALVAGTAPAEPGG